MAGYAFGPVLGDTCFSTLRSVRLARRAIDIGEHDEFDEKAFMALVRSAVAWNESSTES